MEKRFQDTTACQEFQHPLKDKIIMYIVLLYSQESELNQIENFGERKEAARKKALIGQNEINLDDPDIRNLIIAYRLINNDNRYLKLLSDQQLLWDIQIFVSTPVDPSDDKKMKLRIELSNSSEELLANVERGYKEIWGDNDTVKMAKSYVKEKLTPEERILKKVGS